MEKMFQRQDYPFCRFGDLFYLGRISENDWIEDIRRRFEVTGKEISAELARRICNVTDRYSSYVQQLAWFVWLHSGLAAAAEDVEFGIDRLLDACEPLFIQQTVFLSAYQMNFLHLLADGIHSGFTKTAVLRSYRLGTAANIVRLRSCLKMVPAFYYAEFSRQFRLWKRERSSSYVTDDKDENGRKGRIRKKRNYF